MEMPCCTHKLNAESIGTGRKKRNLERRKEKSRDAARCRRSKESEIFSELSSSLPLSLEKTNQLDKASIMRLAIAYLKLEMALKCVNESSCCVFTKEEVVDEELSKLQSIDGFLMILSKEGEIVYLSDNVCHYLGLTQLELMGQSLFEYSHPCDHDELNEILLFRKHIEDFPEYQSFFFRMKCTLTTKGLSVNLKSANYKVLHCKGYVITGISNDIKVQYLALVAESIPHPYLLSQPLGLGSFVTRHHLDMKFIYVEDRLKDFLGYDSEDLEGQSLYNYYHAVDQDMLLKCFRILFTKGQVTTERFRFLAKDGGYCWTVTMATVMYNKQNQKPDHVVCIHEVISNIEHPQEKYFIGQVNACEKPVTILSKSPKSEIEILSGTPCKSPKKIALAIPLPVVCTADKPRLPRIQSETINMFAPKTADMSEGFLVFSEDDPDVAIMKEDVEEEDLTHLAPSTGDDTCIPLEMSSFPADIFEGIIFSEYNMKSSELFNTSSSCSDTSIQDDTSPKSLFRGDNDNSTGLEPDSSTTDSNNVDDFEGRAPYIPIGDDLPLISPNNDFSDLSLSNNMDLRSPKGVDLTNYIHVIESSSLAKLLTSNTVSVKPESDIVLNSPYLKAELTKPLERGKSFNKRHISEESVWTKKPRVTGNKAGNETHETVSCGVQTDNRTRTATVATQTPMTPPHCRDMCTSPIMFREVQGVDLLTKTLEPSKSVLLNLLVSGEDYVAAYPHIHAVIDVLNQQASKL